MEAEFANPQDDKYKVEWDEFFDLCERLAEKIRKYEDERGRRFDFLYPVPKNGMYVAYELSQILDIPITQKIFFEDEEEILVVDDLIDSGRTLESYEGPFQKAVLFTKNGKEKEIDFYVSKLNKWIVFPWEKEKDIEDTVVRQLEYIGEDTNREGLKETPKRVVNSWKELYKGYKQNPEDLIKIFEDGACDEMVILKNIEFYSTCEHHMLPFFGQIHIGYIPNGKVVGVSKLARIVEVFSRRLQIQERLVQQIADIIEENLKPKGIMVVCIAQHFCMTSRGVKKQHSEMITSAIKGVFREDNNKAREEFLNLI